MRKHNNNSNKTACSHHLVRGLSMPTYIIVNAPPVNLGHTKTYSLKFLSWYSLSSNQRHNPYDLYSKPIVLTLDRTEIKNYNVRNHFLAHYRRYVSATLARLDEATPDLDIMWLRCSLQLWTHFVLPMRHALISLSHQWHHRLSMITLATRQS